MASNNFINECKNRASGNRLGQIYVDDVVTPITNSDNLKSFSINSGCYVDGNIIGSVYIKKLTGEFTALPSEVNLIDKLIQAKIGVKYADNSTEYIILGNYKVERPNNEKTANMNQIIAYDLLINNIEEKYVCNLDYSTPKTLSDLYIDVCNQLGLTPVTTTFLNSNIEIIDNPFKNNEKNRLVLQTIGKISCSFIVIDNDNNEIDLSWLSDSVDPDYTFQKSDYATLNGGDIQYGPINSVTIKNSQIDDENVTQTNAESIAEYGEHSVVISEDYILYNSTLRQQAMTAIFNRLDGLKYIDTSLITCYGKPFLKIGAKIRIYISENDYIDTYVLNHEFTYDGTFYSKISSPVLTEQEIKTKQNISLQEAFMNTEIKVNKQEQKINLLASKQVATSNEIQDIETLELTNCMEGNLYNLTIIGDLTRQYNVVNIDNSTFPVYLDTYLIIENDNHLDKYKLPIDYLTHLGNVYDEFVIEDGQAKLIKRIGIQNNEKYILNTPIETSLGTINIKLYNGTNNLKLESFNNIKLKAKYLINNAYTDKFSTKIETTAEIQVASDNIMLEVNKKADAEQTEASIELLTDEIGLKVSKNDVINQINISTEGAEIDAQKISLNGKTINLTSDNIEIESTNFKVDKNGNATMASATLTNGILKIGNKEVFNSNGVLTLLQFQSANGDTPLGWYWDGSNYNNMALNICYVIPSNFVITSAFITLYHIPCRNANYEQNGYVYYWGYSRSINLYKLSNNNLYFDKQGPLGLPYYGNLPNVSQINESANAIFPWTANVANSTTHNAQNVTSGEIKNSLSSGESGMLILKTAQSTPSSYSDSLTKTAQGYATLSIIGYYKI